MTILRWEAPPKGRLRGNWPRTAAELQERAGKWAVVVDSDTDNYAYRVAKRLRALGCETTSHMVNRKVTVWARWPA